MRNLRLAGVVVLVISAAACGPTGTRFAVDGAVVNQPAVALAAAETAFERWLEDVPHDRADLVRCYLEATPSDSRPGDHHVDRHAWCGPVLTLDHAPDLPWTLVTFDEDGDAGGRLTMTPTDDFVAATTRPATLLQADGQPAPSAIPTLEYPEPPALAADHVGATDPPLATPPVSPSAVATFAVRDSGEQAGGVSAEARFAPDLGSGRSRMIAPEGHELLLLDLDAGGRLDTDTLTVDLLVGGDSRDFDASDFGLEQHVIVVPEDDAVVLRVQQTGVAQQLDLRTGAMDRDPRARLALGGGTERTRLGLELLASHTAVNVIESPFAPDLSYDGPTFEMTATCTLATASVFDGGDWAPEGIQLVTVACPTVATDSEGELTEEAVSSSAELLVDGATLEPADVEVSGRGTGSSFGGDEVAATYTFHAPVDATSAVFRFTGHAYFAETYDQSAVVRVFAPAATADVTLLKDPM